MRFLLAIMISLSWVTAQAAIEAYQFESVKMEADYNRLVKELRCLVCQNQNLAGSDADLARDLRWQTYSMLRAGKSPQQVVEFMLARYGDFVLYRPQLKSSTYLLWLGPFVLLLLVLYLVIRRLRSARVVAVDPKSISAAKRLLEDDESDQ